MAKIVASHVYRNAIASADASGLSFLADHHLHVFELREADLRRLGRQIDAALKQSPAPAQKPKG